MDPTKDAIKDWLKKFGHSREWLGEQCGVKLKAVNNWLSTYRAMPDEAVLKIAKLIVSDETAELKARSSERIAILREIAKNASFDELSEIEDQMKLEAEAEEKAIFDLQTRMKHFLQMAFPEKMALYEMLEALTTARKDLEQKMSSYKEQRLQPPQSPHAPLSYLSLPVDVTEFNAWGEAALKSGQTVTAWALETLRKASSSGFNPE